MSAHPPLLGMLFYRPRHARPRVQWSPPVALLFIPPAIAVVDTPIGIIALSAAAVLAGVFVAVRWRLVHAAARIEEIIEAELAPREDPSASSVPQLR
ncbi:hypothetical protein [Amycolatopsis sp. lyj-23]|uniref:hypothetical protein n=1 Tax=Amycolatopsis sp. lyj-23 TaxID=2789283 RepID=UPI00397B8E42